MTEAPVKIELEATGEVVRGVVDFMLQDDFMTPTDAFSATLYAEDPVTLRRKLMPKGAVRIYVNDRLQLIGRIDSTRGAGRGSSALMISGRDYLGDIVDASIDDSLRITGDMTLEAALIEGLGVFGISAIETESRTVRDQKMGKASTPTRVRFESLTKYLGTFEASANAFKNSIPAGISAGSTSEKIESAKPQEGEGAFEWASRLAARSGFTIQPGSTRSSLAVVAPDYSQSVAFQLARPGNIEDGTAERNWQGVPTVALLRSRSVEPGLATKSERKTLSPVGDDSEMSLWSIPEARRIMESAKASSDRIKRGTVGNPLQWYTPIYYRDDESKSAKQLEKAARRELSERLRTTLEYNCALSSFSSSGLTLTTNALASVYDATEDVDEVLWIQSRTLSFRDGESVALKLIRPASYVL